MNTNLQHVRHTISSLKNDCYQKEAQRLPIYLK